VVISKDVSKSLTFLELRVFYEVPLNFKSYQIISTLQSLKNIIM